MKCHQLGGLKQPKYILSLFSRPEVHSQGVGRAGSFWRPKGRLDSLLLGAGTWLYRRHAPTSTPASHDRPPCLGSQTTSPASSMDASLYI